MIKRFAVCVFLDDNKNFLLQDRTGISKNGEEWALFGGYLEGDETATQGLARELKEELGLENVFVTQITHVLTDSLEGFGFVADMPHLDTLTVYEGAGFRVFSEDELDSLHMYDAHKRIIRAAIAHSNQTT